MANALTSTCCVVLAAVVVVYAQRKSQQARIQYEKVGTDVTMQCGSLASDASVSWKVNGTDVKARHRESGPRLILMAVDLGHNGLYSCFENPNGERREQINLRIGKPPTKPTVQCRSNSYPKGFFCTWQLSPPPLIPTEFDVSVEHNMKILRAEPDPIQKNKCHVKLPLVFSTFPYRVNVTAINPLGSDYNVFTFEETTIVKPDPPENVVVTPIPNKLQRLEVTWSNPSTWPDVENFPLKYFLRYRPLIKDAWQHVELTDTTRHTITDAVAGKEYIIQLATKDMEVGTWSDWSMAVHATPWMDEPKPITSTTEADVIIETTPPTPPIAAESGSRTSSGVTTMFSSCLLFLPSLLLVFLM